MLSLRELKNKISYWGRVGLVLLLATVSIGAWWRGEEGQKESPKKEPSPMAQSRVQQKDVVLSKTTPPKESDALLQPKAIVADRSQTASVVKKDRGEKAPSLPVTPEQQQEEVKRVQEELKEIINRTQQLQVQVKNNRSEVQRILERAQIHEQILRTIRLPTAVPTKRQFDADEMIKREKLRLIADQAKQTQEQLRIIQQTRPLNKTTSSAVPSGAKTSTTS